MALGTSRTRNWGKDAQQAALSIAMMRHAVAYQVRNGVLYLSASRNGVTLPFNQSVATLVNTRRGRWEARSIFDDRVLATGISERDVIQSTINAVWE